MEQFETTADKNNRKIWSFENKLNNDQTCSFFGLTPNEIACFLGTVTIIPAGISPMFLSPGYRNNKTLMPQIYVTPFDSPPEAYLHEARHALHYKVCTVIFERQATCLTAFSLLHDSEYHDR